MKTQRYQDPRPRTRIIAEGALMFALGVLLIAVPVLAAIGTVDVLSAIHPAGR